VKVSLQGGASYDKTEFCSRNSDGQFTFIFFIRAQSGTAGKVADACIDSNGGDATESFRGMATSLARKLGPFFNGFERIGESSKNIILGFKKARSP